MAVDPRGEDLKRLMDDDDGGPLVMLNLLRFAEGKEGQYTEYARRASEFLARNGGELVYFGDGSTVLAAEPGQEWDAVMLVRYPSREAFSRMVADPDGLEGVSGSTRGLGLLERRLVWRRIDLIERLACFDITSFNKVTLQDDTAHLGADFRYAKSRGSARQFGGD